jgi:hypothetical protein
MADMDTNNTPVYSQTSEMVIGSVTYIVTTHYNENGRETAEDKLRRYVANQITNDGVSFRNAAVSRDTSPN